MNELLDAPAELLRPIYQMLFIHRRRLQRRLHRKTIAKSANSLENAPF